MTGSIHVQWAVTILGGHESGSLLWAVAPFCSYYLRPAGWDRPSGGETYCVR